MKKRGIANIIVIAVMIVIVLGSATLIWNVVNPTITNAGNKFDLQKECLFIEIKPISCTNTSDKVIINAQLIRGNPYKILGIVEFEDGANNASEIPAPRELETTQIKIPKLIQQKPKTARITAILKDSQGNIFTCELPSSPINCQDNSLIKDNGCTQNPEICDGEDNNCNEQIDENIDNLNCGIGACYRTINSCVDGTEQVCVLREPLNEICDNNIDENCDGTVDEDCLENNIQNIIELKLSQAQTQFSKKGFIIEKKNSLQLMNGGADYALTLQAQINNLPQEGGEIIILAGRYKIKTPITITKNNVIIKSSSLGEVILESQDITGYMFDIRSSYVILENLTLWGDKEIGVYAVTFSNAHNRIVSSIIINFDFGFLLGTWAYNTTVYGNYLFDNGYYSIRVTGYNLIGEGCQDDAHDILLENNFLSNNYQGIGLFCSSNITIRNNTIRYSNISALRVERSDYNAIEQNMFYQNRLRGMWIYGFSDHNRFSDNIVIDNNKENIPFWFDCWSPQGSIYNDYKYNRPGPVGYPYLRQENGNYIFTNYFCQFQGDEIELRNNVNSNLFYNNIIGRYSVLKDNLGWQSINDLRMSFFPMFSNVNRDFLSNNNNFTQNYFLNSRSERIMDQGCDNLYTSNKLVTFDPLSIQDFTPVLNDTYQFHCRQESICNSNGICDVVRGEQYSNCGNDCPIIGLGKEGSRQKRDVCAQGLTMAEAIFPAKPGCTNNYNGSFYCTNRNSVCEPQFGENYCNSLDCTSLP